MAAKIHASVTRKMNRQQIWTDETGEVVDLVRGKSTLFSSCFQPLDQGYVEYVSQVARSGFDIIQVEFYELLSLGFLLPENVQTILCIMNSATSVMKRRLLCSGNRLPVTGCCFI